MKFVLIVLIIRVHLRLEQKIQPLTLINPISLNLPKQLSPRTENKLSKIDIWNVQNQFLKNDLIFLKMIFFYECYIRLTKPININCSYSYFCRDLDSVSAVGAVAPTDFKGDWFCIIWFSSIAYFVVLIFIQIEFFEHIQNFAPLVLKS